MNIKYIDEDTNLAFKSQNKLILLLGVILAGVSIMCEVLFFIDFTESVTDKVIATVTAVALVGCQFVFLGAAMHMARLKKTVLSILLSIALLFLLIISVSGTASFFESRFVSQNNINLKNSDVYLFQKQLISDLGEQNKALKTAAITANDKGNSWDAGRLLRSAQKAANSQADAINKLSSIQTTTKTAGASLAAFTGELRWGLWFVMAALVDICALLCFAVTNSYCSSVKISKTSIKHNKQKKIKQAVINEGIDEVIKNEIINGKFGMSPRVRSVMTEHKKGHSFIKNIFEDLIAMGVLERIEGGRTFNLVEQT